LPDGSLLAAERQPLPDPLLQGLSPGSLHPAVRRHAMLGLPWKSYRLAGIAIATKRYTRSTPLLVLAPETDHTVLGTIFRLHP